MYFVSTLASPVRISSRCLDETSNATDRRKLPQCPPFGATSIFFDYEYERHGVCALFMLNEPLRGWREVVVADQRTAIDFAHIMRSTVRRPTQMQSRSYW